MIKVRMCDKMILRKYAFTNRILNGSDCGVLHLSIVLDM
jgi:hypothetical protein